MGALRSLTWCWADLNGNCMGKVAIVLLTLAGLGCSSVHSLRGRIIAHDASALMCLNGFAHYRFLAKTADGRYVWLTGTRSCEAPLPTGFLKADQRFRVRRDASCDGTIADARPLRESGRSPEAVGVESVEMSGLFYEDPAYEDPSLGGRWVECYQLVDMPPKPVL